MTKDVKLIKQESFIGSGANDCHISDDNDTVGVLILFFLFFYILFYFLFSSLLVSNIFNVDINEDIIF